MMRFYLTILILSTALLQISMAGYGQQISISEKNVPLPKAFKSISNQTGYHFLYSEKTLDDSRPVNLHLVKVSLNEALASCLKGQPLTYQIKNNTIIIKRRDGFLDNKAPTGLISGKVTDEKGTPLPSVTVKIEGAIVQTKATDANGIYNFPNLPAGKYVLTFGYMGYLKTSINVTLGEGQQSSNNVMLKEESSKLDEVVVVGYGTQKRSDLTGSVVSIKAEEIQQTPIVSLDQGLAGRASGVLATQTSGMPGAVASIRIRGSSSLQGGNEPLYVIDGVPVYSGGGFGSTGGSAQMSGLATINPNDIESVEILKDASATAIYGSRGANGVIIITTKSGKNGRDVITFDAYYGIQSVVQQIAVLNGTDYANLVNEAYLNDGLTPPYSSEFIANIHNQGKGTNWQDEIFNSAAMQNYQLSFSGGDEKSTYAASLNYLDQNGIVLGSNLNRYSGRVNFSRKMSEKFKVASHLSLSRNLSNSVETDVGGEGGVITGALKFNPILPVYENQQLGIYTQVNAPGNLYPNPVATALELKRVNNTTRMLGDFTGELDIIAGLKAKVLFGVDYFMNKANRYTPSNIYQSQGISSATISDAMYTNWLNENTLTYTKTINEDHNINLLVGATYQKNRSENLSASSQGFVNDILTYNNLGSGSVYNQPGSGATEWAMMSFLGRANYNYKSKYLFTISGRYDGSSRFGNNNKFAFFPSGAFAWRAGEEAFIKGLNLFSDLKIRTSYGVTGNQEIGLYTSLPTLNSANYTIGQQLVTGFYPNGVPNPNLKWEHTTQTDIGLDLGFFDNNLIITADYYHKMTKDLIYNISIPFVSGFATSLQNIGSVENKGFELGITTNNIRKKFDWSTSFNISFNKNKVLDLGGEQYKEVGSGDDHLKTGSVHRLIVEKPIGLFYGYLFDGVIQNQAELDASPAGFTNYIGGKKYKDISGPNGIPDGKVDANYDRTIVGDPNPDFYGGLTNTFRYNGIELNVFMQYSYGNDIFNYNAIEMGLPSGGQNVYAGLNNRWTPQNPSNVYGKASTNRTAVFSDQFIEDASFLKLKTVTLSYAFPKLKLKHIKGLKVYVTGQNLLTFTDYTGFDPEVSYRGASNLEIGEDYGGYPQSRTFLFGVSFNL